jgi:multidrug efflux pump
VIHRQSALTIAVSMLFSAFLALSFTPALCAHMLKPGHMAPNLVFRWFNRAYDRSQRAYLRVVAESLRHTPRWMAAFAVLIVAGGFLFMRLPGSFLPEEDQGYSIGIVQLPPGSALNRTMDVMSQMSGVIRSHEAGTAFSRWVDSASSARARTPGSAFIRLKPWEDRRRASEFNRWANGALWGSIMMRPCSSSTCRPSGPGQLRRLDFFSRTTPARATRRLAAAGVLLAKASRAGWSRMSARVRWRMRRAST